MAGATPTSFITSVTSFFDLPKVVLAFLQSIAECMNVCWVSVILWSLNRLVYRPMCKYGPISRNHAPLYWILESTFSEYVYFGTSLKGPLRDNNQEANERSMKLDAFTLPADAGSYEYKEFLKVTLHWKRLNWGIHGNRGSCLWSAGVSHLQSLVDPLSGRQKILLRLRERIDVCRRFLPSLR